MDVAAPALVASRNASAPRAEVRPSWTPTRTVLAVALTGAAVVVTRDAWIDIARIAVRDEEQNHVLLVPLVFAWLAYARRSRLRRYEPRHEWAGPAIAALGGALLVAGDERFVQVLWHAGAVLVALGAFLTVAGGAMLVRLFAAFASLAFLVPVPSRVGQAVAVPLQAATARLTQMLLDTFGVAVERWGNTLRIGGHDVTIAEACNGLRMATALMLVTFAFAFGMPFKSGVRALLLLASPLVAIALNVLRLVPTVWACGRFSTSVAESVHDASAWLMPPVALVCLFGLMRVLRWAQFPVTRYALVSNL